MATAAKRGVFVTGTDTGVGKTLAACALLHAATARGLSACGMKPVAAGREEGRFADVDALVAAGNVQAPRDLVNPYAFDPPIAPHIAAEQAGLRIELATIEAAFRGLAALADCIVVEGAGGFMIPLNARDTSADLAQRLALPVVLVVGMRLGCLNHALLTRRAIAEHGLPFAGWICNVIDPDMACFDENRNALLQRLDAPLLGTIAHLSPASPVAAAAYLRLDGLVPVRDTL